MNCEYLSIKYDRNPREKPCGRTARYSRLALSGITLHFCERHKHIAENPPIEQFKAMPMSEVKDLI